MNLFKGLQQGFSMTSVKREHWVSFLENIHSVLFNEGELLDKMGSTEIKMSKRFPPPCPGEVEMNMEGD